VEFTRHTSKGTFIGKFLVDYAIKC